MSRRKKRQEEEENHERWLVSYADFITLLFAFFVVMYAISSLNEGKYRVLSATLTDVFKDRSTTNRGTPAGTEVGGALVELPEMAMDPGVIPGQDPGKQIDRERAQVPDEAGKSSNEAEVKPKTEDAEPQEVADKALTQDTGANQLAALAEALRQSLGDLVTDGLAQVNFDQRWVEVNLDSKILFDSAQANLHQDALRALAAMSRVLRVVPNEINVEGHTDNIPISTRDYPSNWELSSARAASVVHYMARQGLDPARLAAIGMGENRPLTTNNTPEGRATNRRVRLLIMALPPASAQKAAKPPVAPAPGARPEGAAP